MSAFAVLIVDDEELYAQALGCELGQAGLPYELAFSGRECLRKATASTYQLILLDHRLPDADGIDLIPQLLARQPQTNVMMMTAYHAIPDAVRAIRHGASDYIVKEASMQPIVDRVRAARRSCELLATSDGWRDHAEDGLLGESPVMKRVKEQLRQIARSPETTVLLTGETGVGKEVAARQLHRLSRPAGSRLIAVDCLAVPNALAESVLFGHEKGAFTGADRRQRGAFEEAGEGTVFLDEIGDIGELQGKLLRVLECRRFRAVGAAQEIALGARVVAATNRDLPQLVEAGVFRLDLYQRLCVFPIQVPPLRARGEDVLLLAEHFRVHFAAKLGRQIEPLGREVRDRLLTYDFPGNVRELKNVIERAVILAEGGRVTSAHLPERLLTTPGAPVGDGIPVSFIPGVDSLESLERRMIRQAMRRAGNVKSEAARLLGISRYQMLRRLEKYRMMEDGDDAE